MQGLSPKTQYTAIGGRYGTPSSPIPSTTSLSSARMLSWRPTIAVVARRRAGWGVTSLCSITCGNGPIGVTSEFGKNSTLMRAMPSNGAAFRCHSFLKTIFFVVLETRLIQRLITRVLFEKISLYASTGVGRFLTDTSQKRSFARGQTMPAAYRTIFSVF